MNDSRVHVGDSKTPNTCQAALVMVLEERTVAE